MSPHASLLQRLLRSTPAERLGQVPLEASSHRGASVALDAPSRESPSERRSPAPTARTLRLLRATREAVPLASRVPRTGTKQQPHRSWAGPILPHGAGVPRWACRTGYQGREPRWLLRRSWARSRERPSTAQRASRAARSGSRRWEQKRWAPFHPVDRETALHDAARSLGRSRLAWKTRRPSARSRPPRPGRSMSRSAQMRPRLLPRCHVPDARSTGARSTPRSFPSAHRRRLPDAARDTSGKHSLRHPRSSQGGSSLGLSGRRQSLEPCRPPARDEPHQEPCWPHPGRPGSSRRASTKCEAA